MGILSHLIAHGHADTTHGAAEPEQSLGSVFLNDAGGLTITIEGDTATDDLIITFPPSTVEDAVRRRIRGRA